MSLFCLNALFLIFYNNWKLQLEKLLAEIEGSALK